ncbi:MAG: glycogen synthase GlgA [Opitutaceae bacterium]|jgi:starch synthase|nr:glycogen synthase GlgA [Opitutaceae bacterium]
MKIVHAASEVFPYVKTGGLADAVGALAGTFADRGHEVSVFLPGYRLALDHPAASGAERKLRLKIEMGDRFASSDVYVLTPKKNLTVYLISREEFFDRRGIYGNGERDYEDNDNRYIFFAKAVVETLRLMEFKADIVHAHDWPTGLLPVLLRYAERRHGVTLALKTVFTIHNIAFQGVFSMRSFPRTNLPDELMGIDGLEFYGQMSFMKGGLLFADHITTVSPQYAKEIQTPDFGCGLDGVIQSRASDLVGLINGIDRAIWDPATDSLLPARYTPDDLSGKAVCRAELIKRMGLTAGFKGPIFGLVARLTEQKGISLLLANREFFVSQPVALIVLGKGDARFEKALKELADEVPGRVALAMRLDETMSHLVEAGSDFFVMPSLFEPCGLNQMYSQAYGTIPLVTRVGGLVDTVIDIDEQPNAGTGIMFAPTAEGLLSGLNRALKLFGNRAGYQAVQRRCMQRDFSWTKAAAGYEALYDENL